METIEQEIAEHTQIQHRMLRVARKMMESKYALQKEIEEDIKNPKIKAAIEELLNRHEIRSKAL